MNRLRSLFLLLLDIIILNLDYLIALYLRFEGWIPPEYVQTYLRYSIMIIGIKVVTFAAFRLYQTMWRYASVGELFQVIGAAIVSNILSSFFLIAINSGLPRSIYAIVLILDMIFIGGVRFLSKARNTMRFNHKGNYNYKRTMIIGAGEAGVMVLKELRKHEELTNVPVAFIDDDVKKLHRSINGVPIVGTREDIIEAVEQYKIDEIIVAMPSIDSREQRNILEKCSETKAKIRIIPGYYEFIDGKVDLKEIRDVQIEDLLGREEIKLNQDDLYGFLAKKIILVTGGGGSIGSELCRQIVRFDPKQLIILDIYENNAYAIQNELIRHNPHLNLEVVIDSIRDKERMEMIFQRYHPQIVFHAAAHKHVPLMEVSPISAVKNNVFGTLNLVKVADHFGVEKFVNISTDKAVNPTNVMGTTKRICEIIIQTFNRKSKTDFVAVRFGNVLGSNGSVIPLFKDQIKDGGPVTVTDERIIRYFMTIPEACQLVLQAGAIAKGGEIFILDMGEPVKILDLAIKLIKLSGFEPYKDIDIKITGLRPGEKLYEELLLKTDNATATTHEKIFIEKPEYHDEEQLMKDLAYLEEVTHQDDKKLLVEALQRIVPNFVSDYDRQRESSEREAEQEIVHQ